MNIEPVAHIHTDFEGKFGLPRQSGLAPSLSGVIEFEREYRNPDALRGLEGYSHIWLIWGFSHDFASGKKGEWSPTVRPPRLGGNKRVGVFASRSPNRPNPLALSAVKIEKIENGKIYVSGIDMTDGTPIYDIKPYLPHIDSIPGALGGYALENSGERLTVEASDEVLSALPEDKRGGLLECLREDPRPAYQGSGREYCFTYAGYEVSFTVSGGTAEIKKIMPQSETKDNG